MPASIMDLPDECLLAIFEEVSLKDVSVLRGVSRRFNLIGQRTLNSAFKRAQRDHAEMLDFLKGIMPKGDADRDKTDYAPEYEILTSLGIILSTLSNVYQKYIDVGSCCFIPGKVLDEFFDVMNSLNDYELTEASPVPILQEIRNLSSMAIEHFQGEIVPILEKGRPVARACGRKIAKPNYWRNPKMAMFDKSLFLSKIDAMNKRFRNVEKNMYRMAVRIVDLAEENTVLSRRWRRQNQRLRTAESTIWELRNETENLRAKNRTLEIFVTTINNNLQEAMQICACDCGEAGKAKGNTPSTSRQALVKVTKKRKRDQDDEETQPAKKIRSK